MWCGSGDDEDGSCDGGDGSGECGGDCGVGGVGGGGSSVVGVDGDDDGGWC